MINVSLYVPGDPVIGDDTRIWWLEGPKLPWGKGVECVRQDFLHRALAAERQGEREERADSPRWGLIHLCRTQAETLREAAARELREETGYAAERLRVVATPWSDPSRNRNRLHVVLAEGAVRVAEPRLEAGEDLRTEVLPVAEVLAGLPHGLLSHGAQLGGVILALAAAGHLTL